MARATTGISRVGIAAAVAGLVAAFGLVSPASAATLSGSSFEIEDDANLVVDGGGLDWLTAGSGSAMRTGVLVRDDKPTGQHDDSFTQGTNINDTPTTITTGSIPNNKSDLTHFGVYVDRQADDAFVDVFWTRVQAPSGTTTMDFEFNQSSTRQNAISPPSNSEVNTHTIPLRTTGDMLITYFLAAGGTHPTLTKRTWDGSAWGTPTSFSAGDALAGINTTAISAAKSDGIGPLDAFTFGEASIRLSAFVPASDTCTTFGSVYLRSRSSATDTDENKDFIAPEGVTISNCGSVTIHKTDAGGALSGAGFTLYKDATPTGGSRGDEDTVAVGTCSTDASGDCTITDVKKGQYWVVETTVPGGHEAAPDQHIAITTADQVVPLSFVDPILPSTPTLSTTASAAEGGGWDDTATLTGDGDHAVTGSVAFYVCGPANTATSCSSTAHKVGDDVTVSSGSAVTSAPFVPGPAGWYCFRAVYTSTSPYYSGTAHSNSTTECFLKHNAALTVSKTAHPAFGRVYNWSVDKSVVGAAHVEAPAGTTHSFDYSVSVSNTHTDSSWTVTGDITVTNPNGVAFPGVDVSDAIDNGAGACHVPDGADVTVPADDHVVLGYTCTYGSAPSPATGTNTATARWDGDALFTTASSATGTATVDFASVTPSTTDQVVAVSDTLKGDLGTLDATTADNPTVYSYSIEQTAPQGTCATIPNTASVTTLQPVGVHELAADGRVLDSDSAEASLCGGLPLGVEQTVNGTFDRTDLWSIDKAVDQTRVTVADGATATFAYTVTVTPNGTRDSDHAVAGHVSVSNPNDWEGVVVDVTAASDLGGGSTCVVANGEDATIPAGQSASFDYTCSFTSTPAMSGSVTATVTWDAAAAATTDSSADVTSPVSLTLLNETNRTITVVDDKTVPGQPVELGSWNWSDGPHAFTYSLEKTGVAGQCTDYTNVATIDETNQADQQVVTVCGTFTGGGGGPVVTPPAEGGGLPFTGDLVGLLSRCGLAFLAGGALLLLIARRRRA